MQGIKHEPHGTLCVPKTVKLHKKTSIIPHWIYFFNYKTIKELIKNCEIKFLGILSGATIIELLIILL